MIKNFNLYKESFSYDDYSKELSEKEFFDMYEKNCNEYDFNDPFLLRGINKDSDYLYINTDKHKTELSNFTQHKLLFNMTETKYWKGYPSKNNSLDFAHKNYKLYRYGTIYYMIPFNGAKFVISNGLFGSFWNNSIENYIIHPSGILKEVIDLYNDITHKPFDTNKMNDCFNAINEYVKNTNTKYEHINKIKKINTNNNFYENLQLYFGPSVNGFELYNLNGLKNLDLSSKIGHFYTGWTDSKVLMIKKELYDKKYK